MGVPEWATGPGVDEPHGPFLLDVQRWRAVVRLLADRGEPEAARIVSDELRHQQGQDPEGKWEQLALFDDEGLV